MTVLVVRHARAGDRLAWDGDDRLRPLDAKGRRQAKALAETLAGLGTDRLVSSPFLRCTQTLAPAGGLLGLPVEEREELAEGHTAADVAALLAGLGAARPALCTHGDVIDDLVAGRECKKGATWVLDDELRPERYLSPPA